MTDDEKAKLVTEIVIGKKYWCADCDRYVENNDRHFHYRFEFSNMTVEAPGKNVTIDLIWRI